MNMPKKKVTYGKKSVVFETDANKRVTGVKDGDKTIQVTTGPATIGRLAQGDSIDVDLSGLNIESVKEGTTIVTRSNPICFWYYSGGRWCVYCC
jgi:hypothetical protein